MKNKETQELTAAISSEGFDYAMNYYSNWENIKDKKFQELLKEFLESRMFLIDYLNGCGVTGEEGEELEY